jgi:hypothetical protein
LNQDSLISKVTQDSNLLGLKAYQTRIEKSKRKRKWGGIVRSNVFKRGQGKHFSLVLKVPRQYPLVLLVEIS